MPPRALKPAPAGQRKRRRPGNSGPIPMPDPGKMPKGKVLWVGRGVEWTVGTVKRYWGKKWRSSSHWYELEFVDGLKEWRSLDPSARAVGDDAVNCSWGFPEDDGIELLSVEDAFDASFKDTSTPAKRVKALAAGLAKMRGGQVGSAADSAAVEAEAAAEAPAARAGRGGSGEGASSGGSGAGKRRRGGVSPTSSAEPPKRASSRAAAAAATAAASSSSSSSSGGAGRSRPAALTLLESGSGDAHGGELFDLGEELSSPRGLARGLSAGLTSSHGMGVDFGVGSVVEDDWSTAVAGVAAPGSWAGAGGCGVSSPSSPVRPRPDPGAAAAAAAVIAGRLAVRSVGRSRTTFAQRVQSLDTSSSPQQQQRMYQQHLHHITSPRAHAAAARALEHGVIAGTEVRVRHDNDGSGGSSSSGGDVTSPSSAAEQMWRPGKVGKWRGTALWQGSRHWYEVRFEDGAVEWCDLRPEARADRTAGEAGDDNSKWELVRDPSAKAAVTAAVEASRAEVRKKPPS